MPTSHGAHTERFVSPPPPVELCFPAAHIVHALIVVALLVFPQLPGGHLVHCEALLSPTTELYEPGGQAEQFGFTVALSSPGAAKPYVPGGQNNDLHAVFPGVSWYWSPCSQRVHAVSMAVPPVLVPARPTGHFWKLEFSPFASDHCPAEQSRHAATPMPP